MMKGEFEIDIDVPMTIKVRFSERLGQIDDIEFKIVAEVGTYEPPKGYELKTVELDIDNGLHDIIYDALGWDEWKKQCFQELETP